MINMKSVLFRLNTKVTRHSDGTLSMQRRNIPWPMFRLGDEGEVLRFGIKRLFLTQIVRVRDWSEGYNPPKVSRGKRYFHFRIGGYEIRNWRAIK